jgi:cyclopropane fatty-acyl-phospholipid synthase-like methyltransferase
MKNKNTISTVASYYEARWRIFERFWHAGKTLGIHYAYYDEQARTFIDAIYRMNDFIGSLVGLKDDKTMTILDAGCGVGGTSIYLAKKYPHIQFTGITITPGQVELAKRFIQERNVHNVDVLLGDYHHTAFPTSYFDGVFAIESVSYSMNIESFIAEMSRVLKPGGILVVLDGFRTEVPMNSIVHRFYEQFLIGQGYYPPILPSLSVYRSILERHGFIKITCMDISKHVARSQMRGIILGVPFFVFSLLKRIITLGRYKPVDHFDEFSMAVSVLTPFISLNNVTRYYAITAVKTEGAL